MEITEELYLTDGTDTDEENTLTEAWPIPREDLIREFEEYLQEIGVRI